MGAKGSTEGGEELPAGEGDAGDLPDEPEVLPDVPDTPPAAEGEAKPE